MKTLFFSKLLFFLTREAETKSKHKPVFIKIFLHKLMKMLFLLTAKDLVKPRTKQMNSLSFPSLLPIQVRQKKVWAGMLHALNPQLGKLEPLPSEPVATQVASQAVQALLFYEDRDQIIWFSLSLLMFWNNPFCLLLKLLPCSWWVTWVAVDYEIAWNDNSVPPELSTTWSSNCPHETVLAQELLCKPTDTGGTSRSSYSQHQLFNLEPSCRASPDP